MADTSRHLTYFKVENFKRFESFEMKDLGQFNLIVGDNNVGKTSVLEALLVDEHEVVFLNNLSEILESKKIKSRGFQMRDLNNFANKKVALASDFSYPIVFEWLNRNEQETTSLSITFSSVFEKIEFKRHGLLKFIYADNKSNYNYNDLIDTYANIHFNFIPFYKGYDSDLRDYYKTIQRDLDKKEKFIKYLGVLIDDIFNIEPSLDEDVPGLLIMQKGRRASMPLYLFGDGSLKLFRLLAEIAINQGGRLMIDEVDTGIYFKRFKEFWKAILLAAKENDVQLFMTTHNEECIRYFKEVLEEELPELQKDVRNITLVENSKTKEVTAHTFDYDQFEHAINVGNEIRG